MCLFKKRKSIETKVIFSVDCDSEIVQDRDISDVIAGFGKLYRTIKQNFNEYNTMTLFVRTNREDSVNKTLSSYLANGIAEDLEDEDYLFSLDKLGTYLSSVIITKNEANPLYSTYLFKFYHETLTSKIDCYLKIDDFDYAEKIIELYKKKEYI